MKAIILRHQILERLGGLRMRLDMDGWDVLRQLPELVQGGQSERFLINFGKSLQKLVDRSF